MPGAALVSEWNNDKAERLSGRRAPIFPPGGQRHSKRRRTHPRPAHFRRRDVRVAHRLLIIVSKMPDDNPLKRILSALSYRVGVTVAAGVIAIPIEPIPGLDALYDFAVPIALIWYWFTFFREAVRTMSNRPPPSLPRVRNRSGTTADESHRWVKAPRQRDPATDARTPRSESRSRLTISCSVAVTVATQVVSGPLEQTPIKLS